MTRDKAVCAVMHRQLSFYVCLKVIDSLSPTGGHIYGRTIYMDRNGVGCIKHITDNWKGVEVSNGRAVVHRVSCSCGVTECHARVVSLSVMLVWCIPGLGLYPKRLI